MYGNNYEVLDDGSLLIEFPDYDDEGEHRNGVRVRHHRGRRRSRASHRQFQTRPPGPRRERERQTSSVVVQRPPAAPATSNPSPVVVEQPTVQKPPEYGLQVGGVKLGLGLVAGTLFTVAGLAAQVGSHFVEQPKEPDPDEPDLSTSHLAEYERDRKKAERKTRLLETLGRGLSDIGQLAALKG